MTFRHHILSLFALMILIGVASSCSKDSFGGPEENPSAPRPTMGITISLAGASSTRADNDPAISGGYEIGEGFENYLDIAGGNYRIYFFETDENGGTYIDTFRPFMRPTQTDTEDVNGVQTVFYWQFLGEVPYSLPLQFKLVVLANWPEYPEVAAKDEAGNYEAGIGGGNGADPEPFKLGPGKTTIEGLCKRAETQFNRLTSPDPNGAWLDESRLIPFYGVREYDLHNYVDASDIKDGKIDGEIYIDLQKDKDNKPTALPLLRAMAKVEVILNNPFASFAAVTIDRVNAKGFCAPANASQHTDYDHGYTWGSDFIRGVHLTNNGQNDAAPTSIALTKIASRTEADGKVTPERWVAYIPEYKNINELDKNDFCSIKVTLANPDSNSFRNPDEAQKGEDDKRPVWNPEEQTNTIYFATNGTKESNDKEGQASATTPGRYNIERNNIYRFTITGMNANLSCELDVQPYADCPLTVDFGLMRDESGDLMVLPDSDGNLPDYFTAYMAGKEWPKDASGNRLIPHNDDDNNDYFAIRLTSSGDIRDAEVWLKDKDGCRVLSNFGEADGHDGCSARMVRDYSTLTVTEYYKDKDGDQRLQHNNDHSSVVLNHEKEMLFKTKPFDGSPDNPLEVKTYLVESLDKDSGKFWYLTAKSQPYIATEENILEALSISGEEYDEEIHTPLIGMKVMTLVFIEGDKTGNDTGVVSVIFEKVEEEDKKEETRNQAL